jgi:hypothetical protein
VLTPDDVASFIDHLAVLDETLVFTDAAVARQAVERFAVMNRDWWASPTEAYIYNEFADALREGFRLGALHKSDLLADDAHVLACLDGAKSRLVSEKLDRVLRFGPSRIEGYAPRVTPKVRWLDPPVQVGSGFVRLSELA